MVLCYVSMLLKKLWRYFPVFPLFCALPFILEDKLFPWRVMWSSLRFHWCQGTGSGHCLCLLSEKPHGDFISLRMVTVLLTLLLLLYTSLSYLPVWLFSDFTYLFGSLVHFCNNLFARWWVLSNSILFWRKRIEIFLLPWRTFLVPFPARGYNLCIFKLEIFENPLFWCMYLHNFLVMPIDHLGHETIKVKVSSLAVDSGPDGVQRSAGCSRAGSGSPLRHTVFLPSLLLCHTLHWLKSKTYLSHSSHRSAQLLA